MGGKVKMASCRVCAILTQVWQLLFTEGRKPNVCMSYGVCVSKSDSKEST